MTSPKPTSTPLPALKPHSAVAPEQVDVGAPVVPVERLKVLSPLQWEDLIHEWAHGSLSNRYHAVEKCGGAGDMGRDIIAFVDAAKVDWDNYQGKHYAEALQPNQVWVELGKICYYTHIGSYPAPRKYYFVAPHGVGNALGELLRKPDKLRDGLIANWKKKCETGITSTGPIPLTGALLAHVQAFDFSIFTHLSTLTLLAEYQKTPYYAIRFGGGLPAREQPAKAPTAIGPTEARYVRALLDAYGDECPSPITAVEDLSGFPKYSDHFKRSRNHFYSAESLRNFSRDNLPDGHFKALQEQVYEGVIDTVQKIHPNGFQRVVETTGEAKKLQITAHALVSRLLVEDRFGICHQLVNDDRFGWL